MPNKDILAKSILSLYAEKYSRNNVYVNKCLYRIEKLIQKVVHIFCNMQIRIQNVYSYMLYIG